MTRRTSGWVVISKSTTYQLQITLTVEAQMEANHPVFLPRLVPHIFGNSQQSRNRLTMPYSRSPTPMSVASDPTTSLTPTLSNTGTLRRHETITLLAAVVNDSGVQDAALMFLDYYQVAPQDVLSAIAILASSNDDDKRNLSRLLRHLFAADRIGAKAVLHAYLTGQGRPPGRGDVTTRSHCVR